MVKKDRSSKETEKTKSRKLKVGVFLGGPSSEREISLESGRHIYNNLDREKYEVIPIFMDRENRFWEVPEALLWMNTTADIIANLKSAGAERVYCEGLKKRVDFAFLGLHGKFVEDGCLQGLLEILGIPYNGPGILGAAVGMDKDFQRKLLKAAGLNVPGYLAVCRDDQAGLKKQLSRVKREIGFPCYVKPSREGCSFGLTKVKEGSELEPAIRKAFEYDNLILVEEDLSDGMEVTTTVLGNEEPYALIPTETPYRGDFLSVEEKFLPGDAQMITPPRLPKSEIKKIQKECVRAYRVLNLCVYARIDGIWKDRKLYILEPNTLPGVTPSTCVFHQAAEAGMNSIKFFDKIIKLSLEAHKLKIGPL